MKKPCITYHLKQFNSINTLLNTYYISRCAVKIKKNIEWASLEVLTVAKKVKYIIIINKLYTILKY